MPIKAMGLACAVVVLSSPLASAQVNFDQLFSTIAYSDEAPAPLPEPIAPEDVAPEDVGPEELTESERSLLIPPPVVPLDAAPLGTNDPPTLSHRDRTIVRPHPAAGQRIDFGALLSDCAAAPQQLPPPGSHASHRHHDSVAAASGPACGNQTSDCKPCLTYYRPTPRLEHPNLPPPTTLEAYYRSPACYRDLWGGYHQQRMHHCQCHHKHLHGHCECLNPTRGF